MKLFLCPNVFDKAQQQQARACLAALEKQGFTCSFSVSVADILFGGGRQPAFSAAESDLVVSLGGDGSVLRAAQTAIRVHRPLVGINSGRLGYLCVASLQDIDRFGGILSSCVPSERALLAFTYGSTTYTAVNDVVIGKENFGTSADLTVRIGHSAAYRVRGDGLVIATPTGSTAYNYSAGGPVLDPDCGCIAVTPLCAHRGSTHTVVTGNTNPVTVSERTDSAVIFCDGNPVGRIVPGFRVTRARDTLTLLTCDNNLSADEA